MKLNKRDVLAYTAINGVGPATISKMIQISSSPAEKSTIPPLIEQALNDGATRDKIYSYADRQLAIAEDLGAEIISAVDEEYPQSLKAFFEAPAIFYMKGNKDLFSKKSIGIIGTREPTEHGKVTARRVTQYFCSKDYVIVSGLAIGCDAIAHEECITAGGNGIAVLAHGLQTIAPKRHTSLAQSLLDTGGTLVSEFAFGVEPQPRFFVQRDKTQALLSQGIFMVQSDLKGGSLHASRAAIKQQKPLIVPYPTTRDMAHDEPKVQANILIASDDDAAKCELLRCRKSDLDSILVVRGRQDYVEMLKFIEKSATYLPSTLL